MLHSPLVKVISNIEIDYCQDIDIVMPMYNLIEYSDNYAKASESLAILQR